MQRYRYRATMGGGYTTVACWNAIVLHSGMQTRGLDSRANRNGRWDGDLPTQRILPEKYLRG